MKAVCVYESVSNAVIAALERGVVPWVKPWRAVKSSPFPTTLRAAALSRHQRPAALERGDEEGLPLSRLADR